MTVVQLLNVDHFNDFSLADNGFHEPKYAHCLLNNGKEDYLIIPLGLR